MLTAANILETLMVLCFGLSWPLNIRKAWKARSTKGISVLFYFLIWIGYVFAIIGKCITIHHHVNIVGTASHWMEVVSWYVMLFYILNLCIVTCGIIIYFRNARLEKA
jgi:hypothetical protein